MTTPIQVLDAKLDGNDAGAGTVREYLIALLFKLWTEEEGFSGKRPFGNSGWKHDVYTGLVKEGFVQGGVDGDGYIDSCDTAEADRLILSAIKELGA